MRILKATLLAGTGLAAMATAATAQVPMPGFFGSVTGWYTLNSGPKDARYGLATDPKISTDDGWGGRVHAGYRFDVPWDIALGFSASWFSKDNPSFGGTNTGDQIKGRYWAIDGEVGYTFADGGFGIRPFIGVRYANWEHKYNDNIAPLFHADIDNWGIGPRAGFDAAYRFENSGFFVTGGGAGALLFGKTKGKANDILATPSSNDSTTSYMVEGQVGLGYEFTPGGISIVAGWRGEYWWNVSTTSLFVGGFNNNGDRWGHGPFVRVAMNFGPPMPGTAPIVPPDQPRVTKYTVFFDWDRANITPQAADTIRQAAIAYKAGGNSRIEATGHADRSGSDQYNMGLGLRRANAVKAELIRDGVPAANIVILSRGESMPLVQTADGVREPQNRRVEIVLQ